MTLTDAIYKIESHTNKVIPKEYVLNLLQSIEIDFWDEGEQMCADKLNRLTGQTENAKREVI